MADSDDKRPQDFAERLRGHIHDEMNDRLDERMRRRRDKMQRRMERRAHHSPFGGVLVGAILAVVGVLFLLDNLDIHIMDEVFQWWPVILIGIGATRVVTAWGMGGKIWGSAMIFIGGLFLLHNFGYLHGDPWSFFWPVILIAIGIGMLARGIDRGASWWPGPSNTGAGQGTGSSVGGAASTSAADTLGEWAVFGGARRRFDTQNFQGGEALAIFGGIHIDLTKAGSPLEEVRIEANALFGGIDIRVPDTWQVVVKGAGIFGGYEDKTWRTGTEDHKPRLVVTGFAVFGGVVVKT
jgi:predicted membrane protein